MNTLKDENDSLKCQLEAYKNEVDMNKQESTVEMDRKNKQITMLQQTLKGMQEVFTYVALFLTISVLYQNGVSELGLCQIIKSTLSDLDNLNIALRFHQSTKFWGQWLNVLEVLFIN